MKTKYTIYGGNIEIHKKGSLYYAVMENRILGTGRTIKKAIANARRTAHYDKEAYLSREGNKAPLKMWKGGSK